ncbi:hypothetical protein, variant [Aphanomyces invadans]|uniref:Uncharacterized protein n=1 Tax=Aphanomyces invadans TaxID=157072 RepID=A0A024TYM8_9STRA|nr:hypothetical protein H310_08010 [Aphanomyces invadans]XP_008871826.1 hypothetical protein, variant [Aphanomyces invadans]ETV99269.1 hypothetical protein H310_08010 [Aphanomyces invadans]ETV99270.1 hypothetical protein, variant [Aphanomyces invadans]|eukprot:XP_008871825.1 hypothetical protein H310_08010 [Aphanomyces invadans]
MVDENFANERLMVHARREKRHANFSTMRGRLRVQDVLNKDMNENIAMVKVFQARHGVFHAERDAFQRGFLHAVNVWGKVSSRQLVMKDEESECIHGASKTHTIYEMGQLANLNHCQRSKFSCLLGRGVRHVVGGDQFHAEVLNAMCGDQLILELALQQATRRLLGS